MNRRGIHIIRVTLSTLGLYLFFIISPAMANDELFIIANSEVPIEKLTKSEINRIFLLKKISWKNGLSIIPVNREASSKARTRFSIVVLGRSPRSLSNYWNQMHFKGHMPPIIQESNAAMIAFIQRVPGAIGYIYSDKVPENVKYVGRFE